MSGRSGRALAPRSRRALAFLTAALLTGVAHASMDTTGRAERGESFVPRADRVRVAALGFKPLVADYYWLKAVQLVGGTEGGIDSEQAGVVADLVDVATTVDPWVDHAYRFAAIWLIDSEDSVRRANRLLERGVAYHPLEWRNRYYLGFNHFFYLDDSVRAAEVLEPATELEGAPTYLAALVARLRADQGSLDTAAGFLWEMARSTQDPYAEAEYLKALDEIQTERAARLLDAARVEYWRRYGVDITRVGDLLEGPQPVLTELPPAHPHLSGFRWTIDGDSGQIVSSFYKNRYRLHIHPVDAARQERWRAERARRAASENDAS